MKRCSLQKMNNKSIDKFNKTKDVLGLHSKILYELNFWLSHLIWTLILGDCSSHYTVVDLRCHLFCNDNYSSARNIILLELFNWICFTFTRRLNAKDRSVRVHDNCFLKVDVNKTIAYNGIPDNGLKEKPFFSIYFS